MGSLLPSNTFGGKGIEMFEPVGAINPNEDLIVIGNLTVEGQEVLIPTGDLVMTAGTIRGNDAQFTGPVSCTNVTASGGLTANTGTFSGLLTAQALDLNGPLELTTLFASNAEIDDNLTAANITASAQVNAATVTASGLVQCGSVNTGGAITAGGSITANGTVANFTNASVTGNSISSVTSLSVGGSASITGSTNITGNLTVGGSITVAGGISPPPVVPGFQCSSIRFGSLLIVFGFGTTGFDGSVTYTCPPYSSIFSITCSGNSGINCLYSRNFTDGPSGTIRLVSVNASSFVPSGAGVPINLVAFLTAA